MRIAIVGSRGFLDPDLVVDFVDRLPDNTVVITGGAKGVDKIAEAAARRRGLEIVIYPAEWNNFNLSLNREKKSKYPCRGKYNAVAGLVRNKTIVNDCDEVVAFWDGKSRGTEFTIEYAKDQKKPVKVIILKPGSDHYEETDY